MPQPLIDRLEAEIEQLTIYLAASEEWEPGYREHPKIFAKLLTAEARFQKSTRAYLRGFAARAPQFIKWGNYHILKADVEDADIVVGLDSPLWDNESKYLMNSITDDVVGVSILGAQAGEEAYSIPIGIPDSIAAITNQARTYTYDLITQQLDPTSRDSLAQSIATSISLGESQEDAVSRLTKSVLNLDRADMIAQTETVRAFGAGNLFYAQQAGASSKEWRVSLQPCKICASLPKQNPVDVDKDFQAENGQTFKHAPAHPHCRCRVVYNFD